MTAYDKNFYRDLEQANKMEWLILNKLLEKKVKPYIMNDNTVKTNYDFIYGNTKYEVKFDKRSLTTCNFFIECFFNNKKSGIYTSEAKYYIITNGNQHYKIKVKYLKNEMIKYRYIEFKIANKMSGYLIPIKEFVKIKSCINI